MPAEVPRRGLEEGAAAAGSPAGPRFVWVPGSMGAGPVPLSGPVPPGEVPVMGGVPGVGGARVLDGQALLGALAAGGVLDAAGEDHDAALEDKLAAERDGRMGPPLPAGQVAALAVEHMAPGPAMAGWLGAAVGELTGLDQDGLVGTMISARQQASWAQAAELAAVARLACACAGADADVGVRPDGRPVRVTRDVVGQVGLALGLSDYGAAGDLP